MQAEQEPKRGKGDSQRQEDAKDPVESDWGGKVFQTCEKGLKEKGVSAKAGPPRNIKRGGLYRRKEGSGSFLGLGESRLNCV